MVETRAAEQDLYLFIYGTNGMEWDGCSGNLRSRRAYLIGNSTSPSSIGYAKTGGVAAHSEWPISVNKNSTFCRRLSLICCFCC
jgi:hypothetical protein